MPPHDGSLILSKRKCRSIHWLHTLLETKCGPSWNGISRSPRTHQWARRDWRRGNDISSRQTTDQARGWAEAKTLSKVVEGELSEFSNDDFWKARDAYVVILNAFIAELEKDVTYISSSSDDEDTAKKLGAKSPAFSPILKEGDLATTTRRRGRPRRESGQEHSNYNRRVGDEERTA